MSTGDPEREDGEPTAETTAEAASPTRPELGIDPDLDYDAAFAALVAQFSATELPDLADLPPLAERSGPPERPDLGDPAEGSPADPVVGAAAARVESRTPTSPVADESDLGYPAELDHHFEPPEPPPLPRGDLYSRLAWGGVIGGPAVLLLAAFVGGDVPSMAIVAALVAFVTGFVTLVARMPNERPEDPEDGAVV